MNIKEHYEPREDLKTAFLKDQTKCPICQSEINTLVKNTGPEQITEEARCSECQALSRAEKHTLQ